MSRRQHEWMLMKLYRCGESREGWTARSLFLLFTFFQGRGVLSVVVRFWKKTCLKTCLRQKWCDSRSGLGTRGRACGPKFANVRAWPDSDLLLMKLVILSLLCSSRSKLVFILFWVSRYGYVLTRICMCHTLTTVSTSLPLHPEIVARSLAAPDNPSHCLWISQSEKVHIFTDKTELQWFKFKIYGYIQNSKKFKKTLYYIQYSILIIVNIIQPEKNGLEGHRRWRGLIDLS